MSIGRSRALIVVVMAVVAALLAPAPERARRAVAAVVLNVDSTLDTSDGTPGDGVCDDGAGNCTLRAAVDEANALAGEDTINVPAGLYDMASPLFPSDDLVVVGAGAASTELFANNNFSSVFVLENGPVSLTASGVTYTNSGGGDCIFIDDNNDPATSAAGSTVIISDSVFDHCGDAGILAATDSGVAGAGGPVFITVTDSEFIGGGTTSCIDQNGGCYGVLIDSHGGSFTADNITVTNMQWDGLLLAFNFGDGIVDIRNSSIDENLSVGVEIFVGAEFGVDVTMHNSSVSRNSTGPVPFQGMWGGNENSSWRITDSVFVDNNRWGVQLEGAVSVARSVFSGNGFGTSGTEEGSGAEFYGPGLVEVEDSLFVGNAGYGLALWGNAGTVATVVNTTITDNKWGLAADGDSIGVVNSTIVANLEVGTETYSDPSTFVNSILYGNTIECLDDFGQIASLGHNIAGDASCGFAEASDMIGVDPMVGPLQDNGGPTQTMALLVGSPAIDAGDAAECPPFDQRGFIRPTDGDGIGGAQCDIGAYEAGAGIAPPPGAVVVTWDADRTRRGLVELGGSFDITVLGDAGADATASVDVMSWFVDGDPGGAMLGSPTATTLVIPLAEGPDGEYSASVDPFGISEFTSITGEITTDGGSSDATTSFGLPIAVSGIIDIDVDLDVLPALLPAPRVVLTSPSVADGDVIATGHVDSVSSRDLSPAADYQVRILDLSNRTVGEAPPVEVLAGLRSPLVIEAAPVPRVPFTIEVQGIGGLPLEGALVTVVETGGSEVVRRHTGPDGRVMGVADGEGVTVDVDPLGLPYESVSEIVPFVELDQLIEVSLGTTIPTAVVSGTVTREGGGPVPSLDVGVLTDAGGRYLASRTTTEVDGSYEVEVFQGDVTVAAGNRFVGFDAESTAIAADAVIDLVLEPPELVELDVDLSVLPAGAAIPTVVEVDWAGSIHYHVTASTGGFTDDLGAAPGLIPAAPGAPIEVCADGIEAGLSKACDVVFADASNEATATILLTQAALVTGELRRESGIPASGTWNAFVRRLEADGTRAFSRRYAGPDEFFTVGLVEPGDYEIRILSDRQVASIPLSVVAGDVVDLGIIQLADPTGTFAGAANTAVTLSPGSVLRGGRLTARVSAENGGGSAVADAVLALQLPDDVDVVAGSVLLDGEPVASSVDAGWLEVAVGAIGTGDTATIQAWFDIPEGFDPDAVSTQGRIEFTNGVGAQSELLGLAVASVRGVTLDAPFSTVSREVVVSGRAPAGSTVEVTADDTPLGAAVATAGGTWVTTIVLPEVPSRRIWTLEAVADTSPVQRSVPTSILYDPDGVELTLVTVRQGADRAAISFDPRRGVAHFPWVIGGSDVTARLEFSDPSRVGSATVHIGEMSGVATWSAAEGAHVAEVQVFNLDSFGPIWVEFRADPVPLDLSPSPLPDPYLEAEVRSLLRAPFNTLTDLVVDDDPAGATVTATLPELDGASMTVEMNAADGVYTPTDEDIDSEAATGVSIYGLVTSVEVTDSRYEAHAGFFIPDEAIDSQPPPVGQVGVEMAGQFVEFVVVIQDEGAGGAGIAASIASAGAAASLASRTLGIGGAFIGDFTNPWDGLNSAVDHAHAFCSPEAATRFQDRADIIADQIRNQFLINSGMTIAGLLFGPVGGLIAALVAAGVDTAIANAISGKIERLIGDIVNDPSCPPPPPKRRPRPQADPTYIYDPSGYTYELFEDDRLEGVTATVQFSASSGGPWEIWEAEWFLQENPLITDPEGRYGWDVPEGWWRVRFDKDGYDTAYSDALEVLPPHFDVNVGLTSLAPPEIAEIRPYVGDEFIEVEFAGWMLADYLTDFNIVLLGPDTEPVPFTIALIGARVTGGGDDVVKVIRLLLEGPLVLDDGYTLLVDQAVLTYAGIPGDESIEEAFQVIEEPPPPTTTTTSTTTTPTQPPDTLPETGLGGPASHAIPTGLALFAAGALLLLLSSLLATRRRRA